MLNLAYKLTVHDFIQMYPAKYNSTHERPIAVLYERNIIYWISCTANYFRVVSMSSTRCKKCVFDSFSMFSHSQVA